jgi:hypothetical protein
MVGLPKPRHALAQWNGLLGPSEFGFNRQTDGRLLGPRRLASSLTSRVVVSSLM